MPYGTRRPTVIRGNPFAPQQTTKLNLNCNPLGCLFLIIAIILTVFVLTHIGPIWSDLSRLIGG